MCGRFVSTSPPQVLAAHFRVDGVELERVDPDYNVTPRAEVAVVRERSDRRVLERARWGLVPSWADDLSVGDRMINARAESLMTRSSFRNAFVKRRCIVPADGFYEWKALPGRRRKQPVFVFSPDGSPLAFAGLWEAWRDRDDPDAPWVVSCVIITTDANDKLAPIHDRMPAILPEQGWDAWLDPSNGDTASLRRLLAPAPEDAIDLHAVGTAVNRPENNGPELIVPVADEATDDRDGAARPAVSAPTRSEAGGTLPLVGLEGFGG